MEGGGWSTIIWARNYSLLHTFMVRCWDCPPSDLIANCYNCVHIDTAECCIYVSMSMSCSGSSPAWEQKTIFSQMSFLPQVWWKVSSEIDLVKWSVIEFQCQNRLRELLLQGRNMGLLSRLSWRKTYLENGFTVSVSTACAGNEHAVGYFSWGQ